MPAPHILPRKRVPKRLAVIDADACTGCGACIEACPVDCIGVVEPGAAADDPRRWCEVDWDRCIGCQSCIRVMPTQSHPHVPTVCPWEAIAMVPLADLVEAAAAMTGPADYVQKNRDRLIAAAQRQVDTAAQMRRPE